MSVVEAILGSAILFADRCRSVQRVAIAFAASLFVAHAIWLMAGVESCGCFGELDVPGWITMSGLIVGLFGLTVSLRQGHGVVGSFVPRIAATVVVTLLTVSPMLERSEQPGNPVDALVDAAELPAATKEAVFVVGSWRCEHCCQLLDRLLDDRQECPMLVFATRRDEALSDRPPGYPGLRHIRIPDSLWWSLLDSAPPAIVRYSRDD